VQFPGGNWASLADAYALSERAYLFSGGNWLSLANAYALSEWAYRDLRTSGWELRGALKLSVRLRATRVLTPLTYWASQADAYALSERAYRFPGGNG
jgi:hypothetical protein